VTSMPTHHNGGVHRLAIADFALFEHLLNHPSGNTCSNGSASCPGTLLEDCGSIRHSRGSMFGLQGSDSLISALEPFLSPISVPFH